MTTETMTSPALATGAARTLLRLEGLLVFAVAAAAYFWLGGHWGWFLGLFLVPDVVLVGYLAGPGIGAALYNAGHSYLGPALLAAVGAFTGAPLLLLGAAIWVAHVGFDRLFGYGLKHASGFRDTHLGRIGKA